MRPIVILCAMTMAAAQTLAIRNLSVDAKKVAVAFDVVNESSKPVHAWTMIVEVKKKPPSGDAFSANLLGTSDSCPAGLAPAQSCHWSADVNFGDSDCLLLGADVHMTAVLFEDGTVEGDGALIEAQSRERDARLRALQYWGHRFEELRRRGTDADQLSALAKLLSGNDPSVPDDIRYNSDALAVQKRLSFQVAGQLHSASDFGIKHVAMILDRELEGARQQAAVFPHRDKPYATQAAVPAPAIVNLTSSFHVVKVEQQDGHVQILLRNDYAKDIVEYSVWQRASEGNGGSNQTWRGSAPGLAIAPGGVAEFSGGMADDSERAIEIAAVIFRDGSADGNPEFIRQLNDTREGRQTERARLVPLLRNAAGKPDADPSAAVGKLISELEALQRDPTHGGRTVEFDMGMRSERQSLIDDLRRMRKGDYKDGLRKLLDGYQR